MEPSETEPYEDESALPAEVGRRLNERRLTLAFAESCTGGLASSLITDVSGSSDYMLGAVVSYSNHAKESLLGVAHQTIMDYGAVSSQSAAEMAWGARRLFRADIAVSITGVAGPGGGTPEKPVGLVYLHLSAADAEIDERHLWDADRLGNKRLSAHAALRLVLRYLEQNKRPL